MGETRTCPECQTSMMPESIYGINIDKCPNCGGTFFDYEEMGTIVDNMSAPSDPLDRIARGDAAIDHKGTSYICPSCSNKMEERQYYYDSGIHIDTCPNCHSVYLNKGELEEIKKYSYTVDNSSEGKNMQTKGLNLGERLNEDTEEKYGKIKKELDDMYISDDITRLDNVVDFIFSRM